MFPTVNDPKDVDWSGLGVEPPTDKELIAMTVWPGRRPIRNSGWVKRLKDVRGATAASGQAVAEALAPPTSAIDCTDTRVRIKDRASLIEDLLRDLNNPKVPLTQKNAMREILTSLEGYDQVDHTDPETMREEHKVRVQKLVASVKDSSTLLEMELRGDITLRLRLKEMIARVEAAEAVQGAK